jgi:ComF family protein
LISEIGICTLCRDRRYPFANHRSLYEYRGAAKKLIGLYKFSHHRSLSRFFADRLAEILPSFDGGVTIVPVPGNPSSVRHRGWDQVGLIAGHLARDYGAPVEDILRRRRSKTQKSLGFVSRSQNIAGKIHLRPSRERLDVPRDIILLDDVFTTGSTAAECTRVLLRARAERVRVLTLAID